MADIIDLPTGATTPPPRPPRQRGRYASAKIVPGRRLRQMRYRKEEEARVSEQEKPLAVEIAEEEKAQRRARAAAYFDQATRLGPLQVGGLFECLTLQQKMKLLTQRSCEFTHLAICLQQEFERLQALLDELVE